MSGKKQDDWTECSKCKRYFPRKSFNHHQNMCRVREEDADVESSGKTGYIDRGVLFGKILRIASIKSKLTSC
jgi:hypothetical protein